MFVLCLEWGWAAPRSFHRRNGPDPGQIKDRKGDSNKQATVTGSCGHLRTSVIPWWCLGAIVHLPHNCERMLMG